MFSPQEGPFDACFNQHSEDDQAMLDIEVDLRKQGFRVVVVCKWPSAYYAFQRQTLERELHAAQGRGAQVQETVVGNVTRLWVREPEGGAMGVTSLRKDVLNIF